MQTNFENDFHQYYKISEYNIDIESNSNLKSLTCIPPLTSYVKVYNCESLTNIEVECDIRTFCVELLPLLKLLDIQFSVHDNFRVVDCESLQSINLSNPNSMYSRVFVKNCKSLQYVHIEGNIAYDLTVIDCPLLASIQFKSTNENVSISLNNCPNLITCGFPSYIGELVSVNSPNVKLDNVKHIKSVFSNLPPSSSPYWSRNVPFSYSTTFGDRV